MASLAVAPAVRGVLRVANTARGTVRPGFDAARILQRDIEFDPYVQVDHFWMSRATFPPHPHAGFSAITLLFEDSEGKFKRSLRWAQILMCYRIAIGSFTNRDSLGTNMLIHPGDTHWTVAGKGVVHEEIPVKEGVPSHGLQIFCNLPSKLKFV